jgi:protein involved in polysaccharide export with SLBB domain
MNVMKPSQLNSRPTLAVGLLLLVSLMLAGCYSPEPDVAGGYPAAYTGASQPPPGLEPVKIPASAQPAPHVNAASPVLRVSDMITIEFFDTPTPIPQYKERIRDDGKLVLPWNVIVQAAGRSVAQLQDDIRSAYVPKFYHHLTVSVKTDDRVYFVDGEVKIPTRQLYQDGLTVLRAIATAGGFTDFANRSRIELRRQNGEIIKIKWKEAMKNPKLDPLVYPNDQIIVHKRVF